MSLRKKTLSITTIVLVGLIALLGGVLSAILTRGFDAVEERSTRDNVHRIREAFKDELNGLSFTAHDWAEWDDSYQFVADHNQAFLDANLTDPSIKRLDLNVLVYADPTGQIVFGRGLDSTGKQVVDVPASIQQHLVPGSPLVTFQDGHGPNQGLVEIPEGVLLVASLPILKTDETGPARGTLILGRYLDAAKVAELSDRVDFPLAIRHWDATQLPADFQWARGALNPGDAEPFSMRAISQSVMAGYTVFPNLAGQPTMLIQVRMGRDVQATGGASLQALVVSLVLVGVVFSAVLLIVLARVVLTPLARLNAEVTRIGASGDLANRLVVHGDDELAHFGATINTMLQALQDALSREKELQHQVQALKIEIDEVKRQRDVQRITESGDFDDLRKRSAEMRARRQRPTPES